MYIYIYIYICTAYVCIDGLARLHAVEDAPTITIVVSLIIINALVCLSRCLMLTGVSFYVC